jgi:hypothetical protein
MRKIRDADTDEHRSERLAKDTQDRVKCALAEGKALDAAVRRSIELHGA